MAYMRAIWIRNGKTGGTSVQYALAREVAERDFEGAGLISLRPKDGCILELHSKGISYALGVDEFKRENLRFWQVAFKFTLVRNPYDRIVSAWRFFEQTKYMPFEELVNYDFTLLSEALNYHFAVPQIIGGMNYVMRFETLQESFVELCNILSIPGSKLWHLRKSNHRPYKTYYNAELADKVYSMFEEDFRYFGYEKESWHD